MKPLHTVAIVGVGLIGGSIGLAVRQRKMAREVVGVGRRATSLAAARRRGAVDRTTTDLAGGVSGVDLVVIATPVGSIVEHVRRAAEAAPAGAIVTDAGSTKRHIVDAWDAQFEGSGQPGPRDVAFVGSHPLTGDHRTGPRHARADLFDDRIVVVTPTDRSAPRDVRRVHQFWTGLGARVLTMTADEHDRLVAASSHLPHLVAAALAASTPDDALRIVAGGWLDTTRVAAGDVSLWCDILLNNREPVLKSLARLDKRLASLRDALERNRPSALRRILTTGKQKRDAVGN